GYLLVATQAFRISDAGAIWRSHAVAEGQPIRGQRLGAVASHLLRVALGVRLRSVGVACAQSASAAPTAAGVFDKPEFVESIGRFHPTCRLMRNCCIRGTCRSVGSVRLVG